MQTIKNIFASLKEFFVEHAKIMNHSNIFIDDAKKTIRENVEQA